MLAVPGSGGTVRIFVTGASGFIGSRLVRDLLRRGEEVVAITRDRRRLGGGGDRFQVVQGDPAQAGPWQEQLTGCDAVVALAGEPLVGRRWTGAFRARITQSRIGGVERLVEALARVPSEKRPAVLLSASAIGYYGDRGAEELTEDSPPGTGFLADLCVRWEAAARGAAELGLRVVTLRLGVVLGEGGALRRMVPAFRAFVGGPIGSGHQYLSWIHMSDAVGLILMGLDRRDVQGPINLTAPAPVTMAEFARTLGQVLHRPALLRVPGPLVRLALGEAASVLLASQRVLPRRAQQLGYRFQYPHLPDALSDLAPRL